MARTDDPYALSAEEIEEMRLAYYASLLGMAYSEELDEWFFEDDEYYDEYGYEDELSYLDWPPAW